MVSIIKRSSILVLCFIITILSVSLDMAWADYTSSIDEFEYNGVTIPASADEPFTVINDNKPFFTEAEKAISETYETYSEFDQLNRVGIVQANIDKVSLDVGERGDISSIKPTGWIQGNYDIVSSGWLYNRSHLYAHSLGGDDIAKNLMTGTRAFNVDGMYNSSESIILNYIKNAEENVHVLYRVTPIFDGENLLSKGVLIEALCLENPDFQICTFCYNVQPGISLDYTTGANKLTEGDTPDDPSGETDKIEQKKIGALTISHSKTKKYTGKNITIDIKIKDGSKQLKEGTDYTVQYKSNKLPGKATIKITGIGDYKGSTSSNFIIRPGKMVMKKVSSKNKTATVKWEKHAGITAYQIGYRKKGTSKYKYLTCKSTSTSKKITSLKKGKRYQFRIRAYKKVDGKTYYGAYSSIRTVKIK